MQTKSISLRDWAERLDAGATRWMVLPAALILLAFSLFPLVASAWLSLSRFSLGDGGMSLEFVGLRNYDRLLFGSKQDHFLGNFGVLSALDWVALAVVAALLLRWLWGAVARRETGAVGFAGRLLTAAATIGLFALCLATIGGEGNPGSLVVTLLYVVGGVALQFAIGLGLALLCAQPIRAKAFFRLVFFLPLMVTPVGIAYLFRMLADMGKGPFAPLWSALHLGDVSWASDPWAARFVVIVADSWQWVPFMFLVLMAAVENQPAETVEAARLDGAGSWQVFRDVTWPSIAPVAYTVVLIRLIEAFKIVDLPNVLTNGGPGTSTESMTLHAFIAWRTQSIGESAAVGYMLLFVAVISCSAFFNFVTTRSRAHESPAS